MPGICEIASQISIIEAPKTNVLQYNTEWSLVLNINFAIWGTAKPTKAIGPAKAVILPAKILVAKMIIRRAFLNSDPNCGHSFRPKVKHSMI